MTNETSTTKAEHNERKVVLSRGASFPVYGFGLIGAWIYYFTHATTFLIGVLGFFKGLAWPLFLVIKLMEYLKM